MRIVHPPGGNCYRRESDPMIARSIVLIVAIIICTTAGATVVDLTGSNESGTINDAQFVFTTPQPTGTGVIQPFLRVENTPIEQGYNTSGGTPFDDKAGPWTHDLTFGDLQNTQVALGGVSYFKLLLDVNEPGGSKSLISLDQLQLYTSTVGSQTTTNVGLLGTLRYTFGSGDRVILDASRNHGSGSGDMYAYIPASDFAGSKTSDFVYLYAHFGSTDASQAGFEEWALVNAAPIPEMNALFPIIGFFALAFATQHLRRRHTRQASGI
ncbi:MAG: hypothetical protein DME44_01620 [Verrucomicrobia bacterium]|nr:MAG: hypothetical protein DME44_01620 [Verrucomicrobiota bacterium]